MNYVTLNVVGYFHEVRHFASPAQLICQYPLEKQP